MEETRPWPEPEPSETGSMSPSGEEAAAERSTARDASAPQVVDAVRVDQSGLPDPDLDRKLFPTLFVASGVASLAMIPFTRSLLGQARGQAVPGPQLSSLLAASVVVELLISAAAIAIGL